MSFWTVERRKEMLQKGLSYITAIAKKESLTKERAVAILCFNLGLGKRKAEEYLQSYIDYGALMIESGKIKLV